MLSTLRSPLQWFERLPAWTRIVGVLVLVGISGVAVLASLLAYEFSPRQMCGSHSSEEFPSPDGHYKAVLYEYDCGATTDFGTHIAIIPIPKKFDPFEAENAGLIFSADSDHQAVNVSAAGLLPIDLHWTDNAHLMIDIPAKSRIFKQESSLRGISIRYVEK